MAQVKNDLRLLAANAGFQVGISPRNGLQILERAMGIEPTSEAWEASILPLYDARSVATLTNGRHSRKTSRHIATRPLVVLCTAANACFIDGGGPVR
jgi:hypothetical protein